MALEDGARFWSFQEFQEGAGRLSAGRRFQDHGALLNQRITPAGKFVTLAGYQGWRKSE